MPRNVSRFADWCDPERYHGYRPPRRPECWETCTNLYLLRASEFVKIGLAQNVEWRMAGMRAGCPFPLEKISVRSVPRVLAHQVERRVHEHFADRRVHGEWFRLEVPEAKAVIHTQISRAKLALEKWIRDGYLQWEPKR